MDILAASSYYYSYPSYATNSAAAASLAGGAIIVMLIGLVISMVVGLLINMAVTWGVYKKGGYKGWEGVVPFYNNYCLYKMADVEMVFFILGIFFPIVNIYMNIKLAEKFGKSAAWGVGIFFLGIIFMPILGYGDAVFQGQPAAKAAPAQTAAPAATTTPAAPAEKTKTEGEK